MGRRRYIWSSSGVSAGIDVTLVWIKHVWGTTTAEDLANGMEYEWHRDPSWDPFAAKWNVSDVISGTTITATAPSGISLTSSSTILTSTTKSVKTSTVKTTKTSQTVKSTTTTKKGH